MILDFMLWLVLQAAQYLLQDIIVGMEKALRPARLVNIQIMGKLDALLVSPDTNALVDFLGDSTSNVHLAII